MLKSLKKRRIIIPLISLVLLSCCGCLTSDIASRYLKKGPEDYELVETRFGTGILETTLNEQSLYSEVVTNLVQLGCHTDIQTQSPAIKTIKFRRREAKGRLTFHTRKSLTTRIVTNVFKYTYRVTVTRYPSTVKQDYHINRIADGLLGTLKKAELANRTTPSLHQ